jgi:hypothetical protein
MGHYIWGGIFTTIAAYFLYKIFTFFTNKLVLISMLFLANLLGPFYLSKRGLLPFYESFSIGEYLLCAILLTAGIYYLSSIFKLFTYGWMTNILLLGASILGYKYLSDEGGVSWTLPSDISNYFSKHEFNMDEIVLGGASLIILLYSLPRIITFLSGIFSTLFQGLNYFVGNFFTGIFSFFFSKEGVVKPLGTIMPYILGLFLIYFFWDGMGKNSFPKTLHKPKVVTSSNKHCQYYYVHVDTLHIRKNPTDQSSIVGEVHKNKKLCITQKGSYWYYVYRKGWVFSQYIRKYDNSLGQTVY